MSAHFEFLHDKDKCGFCGQKMPPRPDRGDKHPRDHRPMFQMDGPENAMPREGLKCETCSGEGVSGEDIQGVIMPSNTHKRRILIVGDEGQAKIEPETAIQGDGYGEFNKHMFDYFYRQAAELADLRSRLKAMDALLRRNAHNGEGSKR